MEYCSNIVGKRDDGTSIRLANFAPFCRITSPNTFRFVLHVFSLQSPSKVLHSSFIMKSFTIALVLGAASAQSLPSVLASAKGIDDIKGVLSDYPAIVQTLAAAKDITIFLPRDGARGMSTLERYNDSPVLKRSAPGLVEATLTYHVVKGVFPAASVPASAFVETLLTNANYSSVTGGQKLQVTKTDGKVAVIGGGLPASVVAAVSNQF